jgi:hypothetical protein
VTAGRHAAARQPAYGPDRGFAAAAALLALVLASSIASVMAELARLETALARDRKAVAGALAALDACVEAAIGSLPAGWDFTGLLAGDDGVAGTPDDGWLPLPGHCVGAAEAAPGPAAPARFVLPVEAVHGRGRRRLEAVVRRHAEPGIPALLWLADPSAIGTVTGGLTLDGRDAAGPGALSAALAAPGEPALLDGWIAAQAGAVAAGDAATPLWAPPPPIAALAARMAAAGAVPPEVGLAGAPGPPAVLTFAPGDLAVTSPRYGAGLLVVAGTLRVEAPLAMDGVVVAGGGLEVAPGGQFDVRGTVWLGADGAQALRVDGSATLTASAADVAAADGLLALPRRAALASVRDF